MFWSNPFVFSGPFGLLPGTIQYFAILFTPRVDLVSRKACSCRSSRSISLLSVARHSRCCRLVRALLAYVRLIFCRASDTQVTGSCCCLTILDKMARPTSEMVSTDDRQTDCRPVVAPSPFRPLPYMASLGWQRMLHSLTFVSPEALVPPRAIIQLIRGAELEP
jgi:hypothetical protein